MDKKYDKEGLDANSLTLRGINRDVGPDYKETKAAISHQGISVEEWQNQNRGFSSKQFSSLGRLAGDL